MIKSWDILKKIWHGYLVRILWQQSGYVQNLHCSLVSWFILPEDKENTLFALWLLNWRPDNLIESPCTLDTGNVSLR